jgi:hypothetical protein
MRTRISCAIRRLLHIPQELDIFDGLRAKAMAGIPGNRSGSMNDMLIQPITLEPRLAGLVQPGPGEAELCVFIGSRGKPKL